MVNLSSQPLHGAIQLNRPFCFFVKFTIYVLEVDQPWVVVLARYYKFDSKQKSPLIIKPILDN
jgi:hypothetical protein